MMRSRSGGTSELIEDGAGGVRFRMPSKINAVVSPVNAWRPVTIS